MDDPCLQYKNRFSVQSKNGWVFSLLIHKHHLHSDKELEIQNRLKHIKFYSYAFSQKRKWKIKSLRSSREFRKPKKS